VSAIEYLRWMMRRPITDETPAIAPYAGETSGARINRLAPETAPPLTGAALAWAALDHIQARPEEYDPLVFIARSGNGPLVAGFDGRVCLLAGDAAMFDRSERETLRVTTPDRAPWLVFDRAAHLLGISSEHLLIATPPTSRDLPALVGQTFGPRPGGAA
jgi:hypothetical protein